MKPHPTHAGAPQGAGAPRFPSVGRRHAAIHRCQPLPCLHTHLTHTVAGKRGTQQLHGGAQGRCCAVRRRRTGDTRPLQGGDVQETDSGLRECVSQGPLHPSTGKIKQNRHRMHPHNATQTSTHVNTGRDSVPCTPPPCTRFASPRGPPFSRHSVPGKETP